MTDLSDIKSALGALYGDIASVQTAIPPIHLGGTQVDVCEFPQDDGSIVYATLGLAVASGFAPELVVHCASADSRVPKMLATVGGSTQHQRYVAGGTLPFSGPADEPPPFDGVGFLWAQRWGQTATAPLPLLAVVGLTREELEVAIKDGLYAVEAALFEDQQGHVCTPGRPTTPALAKRPAVWPPAETLEALSQPARDLVHHAIQGDPNDSVEYLPTVTANDALILARELGPKLPSSIQQAALLHGLSRHSFEELRPVALRNLQLKPSHPLAGDFYRCALDVLNRLDGDPPQRFSRDRPEAVKTAAAARREAQGLGVLEY